MHQDLIYDIGMNNVDDTAHYLARGYRVVAVEADPSLAAAGRRRFVDEIAAGKLHILDVAISNRHETRNFYLHKNNEYNSLDPNWDQKQGLTGESIDAECVPIDALFLEYGVPYYCCDPRDFLHLLLESGRARGPDDEAIEVQRGAGHRDPA